MKLKNICTILFVFLVAVAGLSAQTEVPFPEDEPIFFLMAPDGWVVNTDYPNLRDIRPSEASPETKKAEDLAYVKLQKLADEGDVAGLTLDDMKQSFNELFGVAVDKVTFKKIEMTDQGAFSILHISATGTAVITPVKGKVMYGDLYLFRPAGEQIANQRDFFRKGEGDLYALIFFSNDQSEKKWGDDMDAIYSSLGLVQ